MAKRNPQAVALGLAGVFIGLEGDHRQVPTSYEKRMAGSNSGRCHARSRTGTTGNCSPSTLVPGRAVDTDEASGRSGKRPIG